jgi:hypothetical protein
MHWVSNKRKRQLLFEAFAGGWQAGLGTNATNPRVLKVIEACFELWLEDATGEVNVLGLRFRRRWDLPSTLLSQSALKPYRTKPPAAPRLPAQRTAVEGPTSPGTHRRTT